MSASADPAARASIPPPPEEPEALFAWAEAYDVSARLDDVIVGSGGAEGTMLPGRPGEAMTFRQLLGVPRPQRSRFRDPVVETTARGFLHRIAVLARAARERRAFLDEQGRDPDDEALAAFLDWLRAAATALAEGPARPLRPPGTFEPLGIKVVRDPLPMLRYRERLLIDTGWTSFGAPVDSALLLLGWADQPPRWGLYRNDEPVAGAVSPARQLSALEAAIDLVRDPRAGAEQEALSELLRLPAWQFALGALDQRLARIDAKDARGAGHPAAPEERVAFRVTSLKGGGLSVDPVVQKRMRGGGFSKGTRLAWYQMADRADLSPLDRRAFRAYDDRFARRSESWGGQLRAAQLHGILSALVDHPAVFFEGAPVEGGGAARAAERLDIRPGRLRLGFHTAADGSLAPRFELAGVTLLPEQIAGVLADDRYLVYLHLPDGAPPQVLLGQVSPQAAAAVRALAVAPVRFPPEAHDALAARLEPLQETVDIDLPSHWTRTIGAADGRLVVRLELLASGALEVRVGVRPVKLGPVFTPGEGPALLLEGQGRDRHGARRDLAQERQSGHALAERLGLGAGGELEPWCWRAGEGDPALHVVATLKELDDAGGPPAVAVEWADDTRVSDLGTVGRGDIRMKVADRRDWFGIDGGAEVKRGAAKGKLKQKEVVPLFELLAAIREGRRYVPVGRNGFVRIEASLRAALERAEPAVFDSRGALQIAGVASDALLGLVEDEAQIDASVAFLHLRRRIREGAEETPRFAAPLDDTLRPYQRAGAIWLARLAHWGAGAILADEMGLGKTVQTLAVLTHRAGHGPALVVAPTSVVQNWIDEAARFAPSLSVRLYRGPQRAAGLRGLGPGDLVVTSYAIATMDVEALRPIAFASLVLDEAQAVKNATTDRSQALRDLQTSWRLALTGTPIENHLGEIWSVMRAVSPGLLGSWEQFRARYAIPIEKFGDEGRARALASLLRPFVLRRTKAEVARELPERTEVVRSVRLSPEEMALYEELRRATIEELAAAKADPDRDASNMRFVLLAALTRLRQLCCHPRLVYPRAGAGSSKAAYLVTLLEELREAGHKVLVFSQFRSFLELLAPRLRQHRFRVLVLDGTTPAEKRAQRIAAFQAGEADVFLISLKAGGFGLNLTAADTVIHMDPWWNPAVEDQATARAHRIGQQRAVTAIRLVARGTIEEAVLSLHDAKRKLAAGILEGTDAAAALGTDELAALITAGVGQGNDGA